METQKVVFRKFKDNEIIALFPGLIESKKYLVMSYMHYGQHGLADYNYVVSKTKLATPNEYADLQRELEGVGYVLKVCKKAKIKYH